MESPDLSQREGPPRAALAALFSVVILDLIGFGIVIPILPFYADILGASASTIGLLLGSYAAMQVLGAPVWGRLSDRIGRRKVMLVSIAGTAAGLFLLSQATTLFALFAARIIGGFFAANVGVASAMVSDLTSDEDRTRWMGLIGASFGIGFTLGPGVAFLLLPWGETAPMLFAAGLAVLNWIVAWRVLPNPPREATEGPPTRSLTASLAEPGIRRLCSANLLYALGVTQLETMFPLFLLDFFGFGAREFAALSFGMGILMAGIQGGAMRPLAKRVGERQLVLTGTAMLALAFATLPLAAASFAWVLVPLALSAVGRAIAQPSMMSLVSMEAAADARGSVMGTFQATSSLARVVGPPIAGLLYMWSPSAPFVLASALSAAACVVAVSLRQPAIARSAPA